MRLGRRWSLRPAAVVVLAAVAAVSGCTASASGPTGSTRPSATDTVSSSPTDSSSPSPTDLAKAKVLASYDGFWTAQVASEAAPKRQQDPNLAKYAIDKALSDTEATILLFRSNGIAMRGQPKHAASVTSLSLADPATASITDCLDSTNWRPIYEATGKSALAPGQSPRVVVESTATMFNGNWVIRTSVAHRDRPC